MAFWDAGEDYNTNGKLDPGVGCLRVPWIGDDGQWWIGDGEGDLSQGSRVLRRSQVDCERNRARHPVEHFLGFLRCRALRRTSTSKNVGPPGPTSPYGQAGTCANPKLETALSFERFSRPPSGGPAFVSVCSVAALLGKNERIPCRSDGLRQDRRRQVLG